MKSIIYIPLSSFIENKGELKIGRVLYQGVNNSELGTYAGMNPDFIDMVMIERYNRTSPFYSNLVKIRVEVNIIYK